MRLQMNLPFRQFLAVHRKSGMKLTRAIMRRNSSTRKVGFIQRGVAYEEQQYMLRCHIERAKTFISHERSESHHTFIELSRPVEIVDVKRGFLQIIKLWHRFV